MHGVIKRDASDQSTGSNAGLCPGLLRVMGPLKKKQDAGQGRAMQSRAFAAANAAGSCEW